MYLLETSSFLQSHCWPFRALRTAHAESSVTLDPSAERRGTLLWWWLCSISILHVQHDASFSACTQGHCHSCQHQRSNIYQGPRRCRVHSLRGRTAFPKARVTSISSQSDWAAKTPSWLPPCEAAPGSETRQGASGAQWMVRPMNLPELSAWWGRAKRRATPAI